MTLVVALAGQHEVIIGAERLCPLGDGDGQYGIEYSKIRLHGDVAFGFAGWRSGISLFDTANLKYPISADEPLGEGIKAFFESMSSAYTRFTNSADDIRVVACGVDKGEPLIYTSMFAHGGSFYPARHTEGRVAIGLEKHGALHFLHTYHRLDMTTNELAFLAYFSIAETIRHDTRVRGPIEIFIVREGKATPLEQGQLETLATSAKEARKKIGDALVKASPDLGFGTT